MGIKNDFTLSADEFFSSELIKTNQQKEATPKKSQDTEQKNKNNSSNTETITKGKKVQTQKNQEQSNPKVTKKTKELDFSSIFDDSKNKEKGNKKVNKSLVISEFQLAVMDAYLYHTKAKGGISALLRAALNDYFAKIEKDTKLYKKITEDLKENGYL